MGAAAAAAGSILLGSTLQKKVVFDPTMEVGVIDPLGYWDPAGFMRKSIDGEPYKWEWRDEATFRRYRAAELKHGRLSMVALTGMYATSVARFPSPEFESSPEGFQAIGSEAASGLGIIFLLVGFVELENPEGNFQNPVNFKGIFNLGKDFDVYSDDLRNKELAHCRLAMPVVLSYWLSEYTADAAPSAILRADPSPAAVITSIFLLFIWSSYVKLPKELPLFGAGRGSSETPGATVGPPSLHLRQLRNADSPVETERLQRLQRDMPKLMISSPKPRAIAGSPKATYGSSKVLHADSSSSAEPPMDATAKEPARIPVLRQETIAGKAMYRFSVGV